MTQMTLINADKTNKICVNPRYPRHLRSPKTFVFFFALLHFQLLITKSPLTPSGGRTFFTVCASPTGNIWCVIWFFY
jgi:hypothetical protein